MNACDRPDPLAAQQVEPLHPDEASELGGVLELVEDWLLHAGYDVHDSLIVFAGYDLTRDLPGRVRALIDTLGFYTVRLRALSGESTR